MGRRSTSSTKSGKFMNPTDQARKEARKRELKKNKKQRMMVRAAVLKMKDPRQIIRDMEKLDEMEFNPVQQPLLNEKVLRDKRKKLRETFERIVHLYERENPETYKELRKLELEYETKRGQLALYFDSVKNAESVEVDSIPLPDMPHAPSNIHIQDIPLPRAQPPSILKKTSSFGSNSVFLNISANHPLEQDCQQFPVSRVYLLGRNLQEPLQAHHLHRCWRCTAFHLDERIPPPPPRAGGPPRPLAPPLTMFPPPLNSNVLSAPPNIVPRKGPGSGQEGSQSNMPPPAMPMRPGVMQMPPPPGTAGAPGSHHHAATIEKRANITSVAGAGGSLAAGAGAGGATISAKPQIINPKAEVTRFVPTALRVRRDKGGPMPGAATGPLEKMGGSATGRRVDEGLGGGQWQKQQAVAPMGLVNPSQVGSVPQPTMKTKDQVYEAFMREMEGLL
ncbi:hypothetical protein GOODEAATRI_025826 [Goodea atripinnis]|uniref:Wbp11/ELF5/Saf1 N-terminal domain-containing protein n=1 Tax=Goodea atripinnis TaxID=208336 RepID=A0ABV0PRP4_9TELE